MEYFLHSRLQLAKFSVEIFLQTRETSSTFGQRAHMRRFKLIALDMIQKIRGGGRR
jgi:hypothetical protein